MRGIKHGMYVNQLASYMQALDIPQDLWEALPTDTDLSPEIKVLRANVLRYSAMLSRGVRFIYSDNEGILHEIKPKADSAGFIGVPSVEDIGGEMGTQRVILSVDVLLGQTLDQLRKMVKTQNDVKPGGDIAGDFRFVIEVSDNAKAAADEPEVPVLVEDEAPITTTTSAAAKADLPKRNKPSRGWDDE